MLKDKLRNIKCEKGDSIPKYLMRFTQCRDELVSVGVTVDDEDLVSLALLGLPKSWHSYQDSVNGWEKFPGWERLWSNLVQEEIRRSTRDGSSSKVSDEENCALATKEKKGKRKKASQSGGDLEIPITRTNMRLLTKTRHKEKELGADNQGMTQPLEDVHEH